MSCPNHLLSFLQFGSLISLPYLFLTFCILLFPIDYHISKAAVLAEQGDGGSLASINPTSCPNFSGTWIAVTVGSASGYSAFLGYSVVEAEHREVLEELKKKKSNTKQNKKTFTLQLWKAQGTQVLTKWDCTHFISQFLCHSVLKDQNPLKKSNCMQVPFQILKAASLLHRQFFHASSVLIINSKPLIQKTVFAPLTHPNLLHITENPVSYSNLRLSPL